MGRAFVKAYEILYSAASPFLPAIYGKVRGDLHELVKRSPSDRPRILDVGGRKSPYTIGLPADITLLDIPRVTDVQNQLFLGIDNSILLDLQQRRSNIKEVILEDMVQCTLPSETYDGVICVEVIEHVVEDAAFIHQAARVLKPGGWLYLTTPNGDYIANVPPHYNPDHVKHFRRDELHSLLQPYFNDVKVIWGIKTGKHRWRGLQSITWRRPYHSIQAMAGNVMSRIESRGLDDQPVRTAHLFATAVK
jgi:SAM-dependent methyltransferase